MHCYWLLGFLSLLLAVRCPGQDVVAVAHDLRAAITGSVEAGNNPVPAFTVRRDVSEVELWLTATDREGRAVDGLTPGQFAISDNGRRVQGFTSFERRTESAVRWIILIDGSDSMRRRFKSAHAAGLAFRQQLLGEAAEVAYFVGRNLFHDAPGCDSPAGQVYPQGETPLFDQLVELARGIPADVHLRMRTVVVLFSDGEDNWSRYDLEGAVQLLQQRNIAVYGLSAHGRRVEYHGDRVLRRLAEATGGRAFFVRHYEQAASILAQVRSELRVQYVIAFRPEAPVPWSYHELRVAAADPTLKLRLEARSGYLVQP